MMMWRISVSYTHLDVYKRQVTTAREEAKQAARYVLEKPGPDSVLNVLKMILEL